MRVPMHGLLRQQQSRRPLLRAQQQWGWCSSAIGACRDGMGNRERVRFDSR